jgi:hypothetical protein
MRVVIFLVLSLFSALAVGSDGVEAATTTKTNTTAAILTEKGFKLTDQTVSKANAGDAEAQLILGPVLMHGTDPALSLPEPCTTGESNPTPSASHPPGTATDLQRSALSAYDARLCDVVGARWLQLLEQRKVPEDHGRVVVEFELHNDGHIAETRVAENTEGRVLGMVCQKAILDPAPYAPWPPELYQLFPKPRRFRFLFEFDTRGKGYMTAVEVRNRPTDPLARDSETVIAIYLPKERDHGPSLENAIQPRQDFRYFDTVPPYFSYPSWNTPSWNTPFDATTMKSRIFQQTQPPQFQPPGNRGAAFALSGSHAEDQWRRFTERNRWPSLGIC